MEKLEKDGTACRAVRSGIRQNRLWMNEVSNRLKANYSMIELARAERKRNQDRLRNLERQSVAEVGLTLIPLGRIGQLSKVPKQLLDAAQSTWGLVAGQKNETEMSILKENLRDVDVKLRELERVEQKLRHKHAAHESDLKRLADEGNRLNCSFDW